MQVTRPGFRTASLRVERGLVKEQQTPTFPRNLAEKGLARATQRRAGAQLEQAGQHPVNFMGANPVGVFNAGLIVGNWTRVTHIALQPGSIRNPGSHQRCGRRNTNLLQGRSDLRLVEAPRDVGNIKVEGFERTYQQHFVQLCRPQRRVRKDLEKTAHQRASILGVLGGQGQPLCHDAPRAQSRARQGVKIDRIEVHHPGCRRRGGLEGNQVIVLRMAQQFPAAIAQADFQAGIATRIEISPKLRGRLNHLGQEFGCDPMLQAGVQQQGAGCNAGPQADNERRLGFARMDDQRQQSL